MHQSLFRQPSRIGQGRGVNLLCVMTLLFGLFLGALNTKPAHAEASFSLASSTIRYGQSLSLSGNGFSGGERIAIWATGPKRVVVDLGYLNAGGDGSFSNFTPATTILTGSPGEWKVTVQGASSGSQGIATFTLLQPTMEVTRSYNLDETVVVVIFKGANWVPGEKISTWITDGIGTVVGVGYYYANADGTMPALPWIGFYFLGSSGTYKVTAYGNTSGQYAVVSFNADKI